MPKSRRIPLGTPAPKPPLAAAAPPKGHVAIATIRASLEANLALIATEREQARTMVEQGLQLQRDGDTGLKQLSGAEIAIKKQLDELNATEAKNA